MCIKFLFHNLVRLKHVTQIIIVELSKTSVNMTHTTTVFRTSHKVKWQLCIQKNNILQFSIAKAKFPCSTLCLINALLLPFFFVFRFSSEYNQSYINDKIIMLSYTVLDNLLTDDIEHKNSLNITKG